MVAPSGIKIEAGAGSVSFSANLPFISSGSGHRDFTHGKEEMEGE